MKCKKDRHAILVQIFSADLDEEEDEEGDEDETEEFGRQFNSYFNEHVDISSNANISFGSFNFCFDKDNKKLFGR